MMQYQPDSQTSRFESFEAFWPYYLHEHRLINCRALHYFGTIASLVLLVYLLIIQAWSYLPLILVVGYGPAWIGHFFIEKNRPATFKYPLWSLMGDYKMFYMAVRGELRQELSRLFGRTSKESEHL